MNDSKLEAVPALEILRGGRVESLHRAHGAVTDSKGILIASFGDPRFTTFLRSCAKYHQSIPLIASGAADRFGFTSDEIAIACSSHSGEPKHIQRVQSILQKIGLTPDYLRCGVHPPYDWSSTQSILRSGGEFSTLHNNCSGKHAGMLALASHLGAPLETYLESTHPVQELIRETICTFSDHPECKLHCGTDGCSAPIWSMALEKMALMFARLAGPHAQLDAAIRDACKQITTSVTAHPSLISTSSETDCKLMTLNRGIIAKKGAEGMFCVGVAPGSQYPHGLGIALKVEDGSGSRARGPIMCEILRQLGVLPDAEAEGLWDRNITNHAGTLVGEIKIAGDFRLTFI